MPVGGLTGRPGALVLLLLAAANRDPALYPDPERFDIRRGANPPPRVRAGIHFCLGAPLARLEATVAVRAFATGMIRPELDESLLAYKPNLNLRGPEQLVVRFAAYAPR